MNEVEYAWAAGFLDGEGCFFLTRKGQGCDETTRTAGVHASQMRKTPLEKLSFIFGGEVRIMRINDKGNAIYQWTRTGTTAIPVIEALLPYLIGKRDEAEAVLDYCKTIGRRGRSKFESRTLFYRARRQSIIHRHELARSNQS